MTPAKLKLFFAFFPYAGNGGTSAEHPNIRNWFADTLFKAKQDHRVDEVMTKDFNDTPITMTRNAAVLAARKRGADVLIMVDSDQQMDVELDRNPSAKPFWDSSFDFLYRRKMLGQVSIIGAPYCGPPPIENVYVFRWANWQSDGDPEFRLEAFAREEAALLAGIQEVAALPTGCIMFDMEAFEHTDPRHEHEYLLKHGYSHRQAISMVKPWFYYEWKSIYQEEKSSTEDVTLTRDFCMCLHKKLGYNPVFCNWDAWAGHWKPWCVGKPKPPTIDQVNAKYEAAVRSGRLQGEVMMVLHDGKPVVA